MANKNLANTKTAKNDEFYTQYPDIQKEINAYLDYDPDVFRGKTVLLLHWLEKSMKGRNHFQTKDEN